MAAAAAGAPGTKRFTITLLSRLATCYTCGLAPSPPWKEEARRFLVSGCLHRTKQGSSNSPASDLLIARCSLFCPLARALVLFSLPPELPCPFPKRKLVSRFLAPPVPPNFAPPPRYTLSKLPQHPSRRAPPGPSYTLPFPFFRLNPLGMISFLSDSPQRSPCCLSSFLSVSFLSRPFFFFRPGLVGAAWEKITRIWRVFFSEAESVVAGSGLGSIPRRGSGVGLRNDPPHAELV